MIVVDASALVDALLPSPSGREILPRLQAAGVVHAPTLVDAEAASGIRAAEQAKAVSAAQAAEALADLAGLALIRHPYRPVLGRAWQLRRNFTVYDALYVALAEAAGMPLLTTDRRLARAVRRHTDVPLAA